MLGALLLLSAVAPTVAQAASDRSLPGSRVASRADDCTGELTKETPKAFSYVVWCGADKGTVAFRMEPGRGSTGLRPAGPATVSGPGASGPMRCRATGAEFSCLGRTTGPLTVRGTVSITAGSVCQSRPFLEADAIPWATGYFWPPVGCPHARPRKPTGTAKIEDFLIREGLVGSSHSALRQARRLRRDWAHGDPVARWCAEVDGFGVPLGPREQRELEYRDAYEKQFQRLVGHWVSRHAPSTFAGYDIDASDGGLIYLGFTTHPKRTLTAFKRDVPLMAPDRVRPFAVRPSHTERELNDLMERFTESRRLKGVTSVGIAIRANKVEVGAENVAAVRRRIAARYGAGAPFEVVYGRPPVPISGVLVPPPPGKPDMSSRVLRILTSLARW